LHIAWIVDAEVSGFFDNLAWGHLRECIQQRVRDGGRVRLLGKWLHAGVLESGALSFPGQGDTARRGALAHGVQCIPASGPGRMVGHRGATPDAGPVLSEALCR
jgi:hypothetical protein